MVRLLVLCLVLLMSGCATVVPDNETHEKEAYEAVKKRAKFDLSCENLQLTRVGKVNRLGQQMTSIPIGVNGCGKKMTYNTVCVSNWGDITCTPKLDSAAQ